MEGINFDITKLVFYMILPKIIYIKLSTLGMGILSLEKFGGRPPMTMVGGTPLPYPPLYMGFYLCLIGGTIPRAKFSGKKFEKMDFTPKTEKKFSRKF